MIEFGLGAQYVLEGCVRKAGNRVRITAQLIDGDTGNHIWAEKYDRQLDDILAVQDEITMTVVGTLGPKLDNAERERSRAKPPDSLDAWDHYQRGMSHIYHPSRRAEPIEFEKAADSFGKAVQLDSHFSRAYTGLAYCKRLDVVGYTRLIEY
jgi:hypothetical protein